MSNDRSISVSIVSFNTKDATLECLASLAAASDGLDVRVTVVDNASRDGSADAVAQQFPGVRLVRNATNQFFTGGHNAALKDARGEFVAIVNSDTVIGPTVLRDMVAFFDRHPEVGAAACRYVGPDGRPMAAHAHNFWRFHSLLFNVLCRHRVGVALYRLLGGSDPAPTETEDAEIIYADVVSDAFLMLRREVLDRIGPYDETMKLYGTEDDICRRTTLAGWKVAVNPNARIVHHLSGSVRKAPPLMIRRIFRDDSIALYRKHGTRLERLLAAPLLHAAYVVEAIVLTLGYRMKFRAS